MAFVSSASSQEHRTHRVFFQDAGSDGQPPVGGVVCWKHDEPVNGRNPLTQAAESGQYRERELGRVVVKPTANTVGLFAGIVINAQDFKAQGGADNSGFIDIARVERGDVADVLVKVNATAGTTLLVPVAGEWSLGNDLAFDQDTVGKALETDDTSAADELKRILVI